MSLFLVDLKEFDSLKSVELRLWTASRNINIVSIAQTTNHLNMYVIGTPANIEEMRQTFVWIGDVHKDSNDVLRTNEEM